MKPSRNTILNLIAAYREELLEDIIGLPDQIGG